MSTELSTSRSKPSWFHVRLWTTWFPVPGRPLKSVLANNVFRLFWAPLGWPLTLVTLVASWHRLRQQSTAPGDPGRAVVAVGNWIVGGAGKTPACMALALGLSERGWRPCILSRGAGRLVTDSRPRLLLPERLGSWRPEEVGDEPWLLCWRTGCPVAVAADRWAGAMAMVAMRPEINVFILDDGLSQSSIRPDLRILVVDDRLHGNGALLPLGPLRQPWPPRAGHLPDLVLIRDNTPLPGVEALLAHCSPPPAMARLKLEGLGLTRPQRGDGRIVERSIDLGQAIAGWTAQGDRPVVALAGVARPDTFFDDLQRQGVRLVGAEGLADHASLGDIEAAADRLLLPLTGRHPVLLMTEKDAVKFLMCAPRYESDHQDLEWWALSQRHRLPDDQLEAIHNRIKMTHGQKTS
jgi:tetraacyldisaccharide 4'-kinase